MDEVKRYYHRFIIRSVWNSYFQAYDTDIIEDGMTITGCFGSASHAAALKRGEKMIDEIIARRTGLLPVENTEPSQI
jgi:hypothetical protein